MKFLKKIKILFFIIVVITISFIGYIFNTPSSYSKMNSYNILMDTLNNTNAKFKVGEVHIKENKVPSTFPNEYNIFNYVTNHHNPNVITYLIFPDTKKYVCEYNNSTITLITRVENNERFLSVTISQNSYATNFNDIYNRFDEIYHFYDISPIYVSSISGEYQNALTSETNEIIISSLLSYIRATEVTSIKTGNTLSITGISPSFSNQSNIKNINFNIGIRSSESDDKTYITLATPIIINEY